MVLVLLVLMLVMLVVWVLLLLRMSLCLVVGLFGSVVSRVFWSRRIAYSCDLRSGEGGVVRVALRFEW